MLEPELTRNFRYEVHVSYLPIRQTQLRFWSSPPAWHSHQSPSFLKFLLREKPESIIIKLVKVVQQKLIKHLCESQTNKKF